MMLALLLALVTATSIPPKPAGYVTDNAHVLDGTRAHVLNEKLAQLERETSNQILVYVDRKLPPDTTIEQFANEAIHQWGVGQKGKDNGAVLFLFIDDRKMRIEVGYGLEAVLTDARSRQITSTIIKPYLQRQDFTGAVEAGAIAMIETVRAEHSQGTGKTVHETKASKPLPIAFGFILLAFVASAALLVFFLIRMFVRRVRTPGAPGSSNMGMFDSSNTGTSDSSSSSSSSWSSDSSSSSSDSSSFDGGGGDSGGGGSSDSW